MSNVFAGYRITSPYGYRTHPITKKRAFHTGIDLVISHKAPIDAFTAGTVLHAGMGQKGTGFGGYGNVVAIKDKKGHLHVYAHLDSVSVKKGQSVKQGQEIGKQGSTGNSTGSHLHYEIRKTTSPSFGWIADRANNCYEPTAYLEGFYKEEAPAKPAPAPAKVKEINDIRILGHIEIVNVNHAAYICDKPSSTNSKNLGLAIKGGKLPISGSVPGWWEVVYEGRRAYVNENYGRRV